MEQSVKAHQRPKLTFDEVVAMDLDMVTHNYCKLFGLSDSTAAGLKKRLSHGITVRRQPTLPPANASEG